MSSRTAPPVPARWPVICSPLRLPAPPLDDSRPPATSSPAHSSIASCASWRPPASFHFDDLQLVALELRLLRKVVLADPDAEEIFFAGLEGLDLLELLLHGRLRERVRALALDRPERFGLLV